MSLVCAVPASFADGNDYPYAGLGKCPLVPLKHKPHGTQDGSDKPHKPGQNGPGQNTPGKPDKPAPPRQCAKHIWFYQGSYGDPWGFALRNCTSFVAWRLRMTNGLADFDNYFGGIHWGNAAHWDRAASRLGYLVDDVPAVGAVAQTDQGAKGHVAWVESVGDGTVTVEEYNYDVAGGYDVRTVPTSSFTYLHVKDLGPGPDLGSTRAGVATTDAHGGAWSARTTDGGRLIVHRPSGRSSRLRAAGDWSATAAPSILTDSQGRVWVAAVTASGQVLAAHTGTASAAFSRPHRVLSGATTSSPALALDGQGRVRVLAVTGAGTLLERHTTSSRSDRWSHVQHLGAAGSWSVHAAPATVTDVHGRLWVAAVSARGHLLTQHTTHQGNRWSGFHAVDRHTWSVTSTPALGEASGGRLWLASVGTHGGLVLRHTGPGLDRWQPGQRLSGLWSPYSSPALSTDDSGRTWLAAVGTDGEISVLWQPAGAKRWRGSRGLPRVPASETTSPALASNVDGILVGAQDAHGGTVWRRPRGQSGLPAAHGPRGGGFSVSPFL